MNRTLTLWSLLVALAWAAGSPALAAPVQGLYGAAVPVERRVSEPDATSLRAALAAVLVKVTGLADVAAQPGAFALLDDAGRYLQQHGYTADGEIWIGFDAAAVRADVLALGLPLWGEDRPTTVVWLAIDLDASERELVGADDRSGIQDTLLAVASRRGLPVVLPLLDSEDLALVTFSDVWGGFEREIEAASARYQADAMLVGRARGATLDELFVRWRLVVAGTTEEWSGGLADGIERAASILAARFASIAEGRARLTIAISNIDSVRGYAEVLEFLGALNLVQGVAVERVTGNTVIFAVTTIGEPEKLRSEIGLASFLAAPADAGGQGVGAVLKYEYRPSAP